MFKIDYIQFYLQTQTLAALEQPTRVTHIVNDNSLFIFSF